MVSNLKNGVDVYALPLLERLKHYPFPIHENKLQQVTLPNDHRWLVCGGDMGYARIFDALTAEMVMHLEHQ